MIDFVASHSTMENGSFSKWRPLETLGILGGHGRIMGVSYSKLLVSPSLSSTKLPYIIPYITPFTECRLELTSVKNGISCSEVPNMSKNTATAALFVLFA